MAVNLAFILNRPWAAIARRVLPPTLVFLFPVLYNLRLIAPSPSLLVLQNDFGYLYHVYKAYLVDLIAHGHFPLWSPGEACGYGFFANPFTAPLYPLNVLPLGARLAFGNYNYWFHQIFAVLGVSWFALGIYRWLHQTTRQQAPAVFAAILISCSWCVGLFLRFPNAIHTLAWVPWVLASLHAVHRQARLGPLLFGAFALICEITAGYPYFVVYSYFFYTGYALYLQLRSGWKGWRPQALRKLILLAAPTLITLPYSTAVSGLMKVTTDRGGGSFAYATEHGFGPVDLMGSLLFPPIASVEGCFYTGVVSVFLIIVYLHLGRGKEKLYWLAGVLLVLATMMNAQSYLFTPLWNTLPVFNQMRAYSRMAVLLLPLIAVALHRGFALLQRRQASKGKALQPRYVLTLFGVALAVQLLLYSFKSEALTIEYDVYVKPRVPAGSTELDFLMYTVLTAAAVLLFNQLPWKKYRHGAVMAVAFLLFVGTFDTGNQGRFLWTQSLVAAVGPGQGLMRRAYERGKQEANLFPLIDNYFELPRTSEEARLTAKGLTNKPMPNFYYKRYVEFYQELEKSPHAKQRLMGKQKLFFHAKRHDDPKQIDQFVQDVDATQAMPSDPVIESYDGDALELRVNTNEKGYLTWLDNWDEGWSALVDGQPVEILTTLGTFKTVELPKGQHQVSFRYRVPVHPLAYVGAGLGLVAFAGYAGWRVRRKRRKAKRLGKRAMARGRQTPAHGH